MELLCQEDPEAESTAHKRGVVEPWPALAGGRALNRHDVDLAAAGDLTNSHPADVVAEGQHLLVDGNDRILARLMWFVARVAHGSTCNEIVTLRQGGTDLVFLMRFLQRAGGGEGWSERWRRRAFVTPGGSTIGSERRWGERFGTGPLSGKIL